VSFGICKKKNKAIEIERRWEQTREIGRYKKKEKIIAGKRKKEKKNVFFKICKV
jgi:hypothetical protein